MKCMGKNEKAGPELEKALSFKEIDNSGLNIPYLLIGLSDQQFNAGAFTETLETLKKLKEHQIGARDLQ